MADCGSCENLARFNEVQTRIAPKKVNDLRFWLVAKYALHADQTISLSRSPQFFHHLGPYMFSNRTNKNKLADECGHCGLP